MAMGQHLTKRDFKKDIYDMVSIEGLREYILAVFREAAIIFSEKTSKSKDIVKNVKRYIQKNYSTDISLELLSSKMFIFSILS